MDIDNGVRLFGSFAAGWAGQPLVFRSNKVRALLAYLLIEARRAHHRDALADLLWESYPASNARTNLRVTLSQLQQTLAPLHAAFPGRRPVLSVTRDTLQAQPADWPDWPADVERFDALIGSYRAHQHPDNLPCQLCLDSLEQAVRLYRGDLLATLRVEDSPAFADWAQVQREARFHQLLLALDRLTQAGLAQANYLLAEEYARRQLEWLPWQESAHRQLMTALAAAGHSGLALEQYALCRRVLGEELGIEPDSETHALYLAIRAGTLEALPAASRYQPQPPPAAGDIPAARLPLQPTPLFGREDELADLERRLGDPAYRLVSLVGPGGIGKTRLAVSAAAGALAQFAGAVWFVPLGASESPDAAAGPGAAAGNRLAAAISRTLGLVQKSDGPLKALVEYLRLRPALLVLDNLEHLLDETAVIDTLLRSCPALHLLVTSREALRLRAESVVALAGLATPDLPARDARAFGSVQLFLDRAERVAGPRDLPAADLAAVSTICRFVEGSPLAIELAASWTRYLPLAEIAHAIQHDLDFLRSSLRDVPERHRSMRAVFEGSWRLLTAREQDLLVQLTVFRGGWTAQAARTVVGADAASLYALIDKTLLDQRSGRYGMHNLVRQFAYQQRAARPIDYRRIEHRHGLAYVSLLRRHTAALTGPNPQPSARLLLQDLDNIRQAWLWAAAGGLTHVLAASLPAMLRLYDLLGLYHEGSALLTAGIDLIGALRLAPARQRVLARLLIAQAAHLNAEARYAAAEATAGQAFELARTLADARQQAASALQIGIARRQQGRFAAAEEALQRSLTLARAVGSAAGEAHAARSLGFARYLRGEHAAALEHYRAALAIYRQINDSRSEMLARNNLALVLLEQGDCRGAWQLLSETLPLCLALGDSWGEALTRNNLGSFYSEHGDCDQAAVLFGQALELRRRIGDRWGEAITLSNLAGLAIRQSDYRLAHAYSLDAIEHARAISDRPTEGHALCHGGAALLALGRLDEAAGAFEQSLLLRGGLGQDHLLIEAYAGLAEVAARRGDDQPTRRYLGLIMEALGERPRPTPALIEIAWTCQRLLQPIDPSRAETLLLTVTRQINGYLRAAPTPDLRQHVLRRMLGMLRHSR